jgi:hypothetical protein
LTAKKAHDFFFENMGFYAMKNRRRRALAKYLTKLNET